MRVTGVLCVETDAYEAASRIVGADVAEALATAGWRLLDRLAGSAAMAGTDSAGRGWADAYDRAAGEVLQAGGQLATASFRLAALLQQTGFNYALAESASTLGEFRRSGPDRTGWDGQCCVLWDPPSAAGGSAPEPAGWSLVAHAVGYVWPNGHQDRLRAGAAAWRAYAVDLWTAAQELARVYPSLAAQDAPETPAALTACRGLADQLGEFAAAADSLGGACDEYAGHLDEAHSAVLDELRSLLEWTAGIEVAGAALAVISLGASEAAAQAAEAARIAAAAARITSVLSRLADLARVAAEYVANLGYRAAAVVDELRPLLSARIVVALVDGVESGRFAATAAATAEQRLAGLAETRTRIALLDDPKRFDPQSLRALNLGDLHVELSARWGDGAASRSGGDGCTKIRFDGDDGFGSCRDTVRVRALIR